MQYETTTEAAKATEGLGEYANVTACASTAIGKLAKETEKAA